jgi:hypothetical protein
VKLRPPAQLVEFFFAPRTPSQGEFGSRRTRQPMMLAVDRHGPSVEPRRPPPARELVRLSFLVSDGLYFCEGSYEVLNEDPEGGPVLTAGGELLVPLVDFALEKRS